MFSASELIGNAGLKSSDVAKGIGTAIDNFIQQNPSHLKQINVVVFQAAMLSDFQANIKAIQPQAGNAASTSSSSRSTFTTTTSHQQAANNIKVMLRLFPPITDYDPDHSISLFLTSNDGQQIKRVNLLSSLVLF